MAMEPMVLDDDFEDLPPTRPGVCILPEWVVQRPPEGEPVLEDPSSWESDLDTKKFRVLG
jgi:hypothetical protein